MDLSIGCTPFGPGLGVFASTAGAIYLLITRARVVADVGGLVAAAVTVAATEGLQQLPLVVLDGGGGRLRHQVARPSHDLVPVSGEGDPGALDDRQDLLALLLGAQISTPGSSSPPTPALESLDRRPLSLEPGLSKPSFPSTSMVDTSWTCPKSSLGSSSSASARLDTSSDC